MRFGLVLALALSAGCSNKLDAYGPTDDREPSDDDETDLPEDTDVEDTDPPADTDVPEDDFDDDGFTEDDGDCDDADDTVFPDAPELCDGLDNDCDGQDDTDFDDDLDGTPDCSDGCPIYVDDDATWGAETGTFTDPFLWVQDAIDAAAALQCDVIRVRPGDYLESIDYLGQDLDVGSTEGPTKTFLRGNGTASVVNFDEGEGLAGEAILDGFTVTDGGGAAGAGIYVLNSDPTIFANVIEGNDANAGDHQGGGIYLNGSSAWVYGNEILGNDAGLGGGEAGNDGGGLFVRGGAPVIEDNRIEANTAGDGGGLWFARSDALVIGNLIAGNEATDSDPDKGGQGGGVDIQIGTTDFVLAGNVIVGNVASTHGGGVAIFEYAAEEGDPTVVNNTIAFNDVVLTDNGAGLLGWYLTRGTVVNNVITGNHGSGAHLNGTTVFRYNDVYGNTTDYAGDRGALTGVDGNVSVPPAFVGVSDDGDYDNDTWTLQAGSQLRNAGDPAILDRDGSRSDLGATGGPHGF